MEEEEEEEIYIEGRWRAWLWLLCVSVLPAFGFFSLNKVIMKDF